MSGNINQEKLIREGNLSAFESFYKMNFPRLVGYARLFLAEVDVCEDIVQETFFQIWNNREKIDHRQSLKGFIFTTVRNRCLNELKHRKIHEQFIDFALHDELIERFYRFDFEAGNLSGFHDNGQEWIQKVHKAIEALPPKRKKVFKLCKIEGLKNSEVAQMQGISIKGVERHITKANKFIRDFAGR